jgi:hypothetical protein
LVAGVLEKRIVGDDGVEQAQGIVALFLLDDFVRRSAISVVPPSALVDGVVEARR